MMRRRTFLSSVGALALTPVLPALTLAQEETKSKFTNSPDEICGRIMKAVGTRPHKIAYIAVSKKMPQAYLAKHTTNPKGWDCRVMISMPTRPDGGCYFFLPTECYENAIEGRFLYHKGCALGDTLKNDMVSRAPEILKHRIRVFYDICMWRSMRHGWYSFADIGNYSIASAYDERIMDCTTKKIVAMGGYGGGDIIDYPAEDEWIRLSNHGKNMAIIAEHHIERFRC
jgi:hypothetical protein